VKIQPSRWQGILCLPARPARGTSGGRISSGAAPASCNTDAHQSGLPDRNRSAHNWCCCHRKLGSEHSIECGDETDVREWLVEASGAKLPHARGATPSDRKQASTPAVRQLTECWLAGAASQPYSAHLNAAGHVAIWPLAAPQRDPGEVGALPAVAEHQAELLARVHAATQAPRPRGPAPRGGGGKQASRCRKGSSARTGFVAVTHPRSD
jgi:hypothetical protein